MKRTVLVGLGGVAVLGCVAALISGVDALIVMIVVSKLVWLAGLVTAVKAREWWWALAILVFGMIPACIFAWMHLRGPRKAAQPTSLFAGEYVAR